MLQSLLYPGKPIEHVEINAACIVDEQTPNQQPGFVRKSPLVPRKAHSREVFHPYAGEVLDRCVVLWIPGPRTSTGEDLVELHFHGSRAVVDGVLSAMSVLSTTSPSVRCNSNQKPIFLRVRSADPREFTRRALFHGVVNLLEVEALSDLLNADTSLQKKQALA